MFGVPDEKWGEAVKAVVALDKEAVGEAGEVSADDLITWARERLAAYKCPKTVDFLEALPRTLANPFMPAPMPVFVVVWAVPTWV